VIVVPKEIAAEIAEEATFMTVYETSWPTWLRGDAQSSVSTR